MEEPTLSAPARHSRSDEHVVEVGAAGGFDVAQRVGADGGVAGHDSPRQIDGDTRVAADRCYRSRFVTAAAVDVVVTATALVGLVRRNPLSLP